MLGSQALDTGIGIALLLFVLATVASTILELGVRVTRLRARDLERALHGFLVGTPPGRTTPEGDQLWKAFTETSVYAAAKTARGQAAPAYLSAKAFAESIVELIDHADHPLTVVSPLQKRVAFLLTTVDQDLTTFKAGLERWYDDAMAGLTAQYRRWSAIVLLGLGFGLAALTNASLPHVARELWFDPVARDAAVAAAGAATAPAAVAGPALDQIGAVVAQTRQVAELGLPVGWDSTVLSTTGFWFWLWHVVGWALTAVLVSLGAPFWFDLLGRLTSVRSPRPQTAAEDETSASRAALQPSPSGPATSPAAVRFWSRAASVAALDQQARGGQVPAPAKVAAVVR
jgi:hypothetical protein